MCGVVSVCPTVELAPGRTARPTHNDQRDVRPASGGLQGARRLAYNPEHGILNVDQHTAVGGQRAKEFASPQPGRPAGHLVTYSYSDTKTERAEQGSKVE